MESYEDPAGEELMKAIADGSATPAQSRLFDVPCAPEALFRISVDPHQLENLVGNPEFAAQVEQARAHLKQWTEETGDTPAEDFTPDRYASPPAIVDGEIIRVGRQAGERNPHRQLPGATTDAWTTTEKGPH